MNKTARGKIVRDWLVVAVLKSVIFISKALPYRQRVKWGGAAIAVISRHFEKAYAPIIRHHAMIYPEQSEQTREDFAKVNLHHFGKNMIELYNIADFARRTERFHVSGPGLDQLLAQKKAGHGAVCVSGHFGQWEAIRAYMAANDMEMGGLYKEHSNRFYEVMFGQALRHSGPMFHTGVRGMSGLVRILRKGGFISLLHDQKVKGAPLIDFLGVPVHTSTAAADLALKYNVPLVPIYGVRRADGYHYDVIVEEPIAPSDSVTMTRAMNDNLSNMVHKHPEQWLWLYNRWKIWED